MTAGRDLSRSSGSREQRQAFVTIASTGTSMCDPTRPRSFGKGNEPGEDATITFRSLHEQVCKFAKRSQKPGVNKGDRVSIYMPMVPEATIAMLASRRIGAVHSVVFGGFSAEALADRIVDSNCKTLITANGTFRGAKAIPMKPNADKAMSSASAQMEGQVETCIVVQRVSEESGIACHMQEGARFVVGRGGGRSFR